LNENDTTMCGTTSVTDIQKFHTAHSFIILQVFSNKDSKCTILSMKMWNLNEIWGEGVDACACAHGTKVNVTLKKCL